MALSGLSDSSFFSQIATAIIFKKNNRTSSKIPHKIYDEKKFKPLPNATDCNYRKIISC